ncbi:hypothetical protein [Radicibacter daui]|uniref:hypothetical protein n=1 Tax=Radicibacter daui TaxID=3064829 RepID=UPI0040469B82
MTEKEDVGYHLSRIVALLRERGLRQIARTEPRLVKTVALCGGSFMAGIFVVSIFSDLSAGDWAAWVQAIGSIAALFIAIGIAQWQVAETRRDAEARIAEERERALQLQRATAASVAGEITRHRGELEKSLRKAGQKINDSNTWHRLKDELQKLQLPKNLEIRLPTDLLAACRAIRLLEIEFSEQIEEWPVNPNPSPAHLELRDKMINTGRGISAALNTLEQALRAFAQAN